MARWGDNPELVPGMFYTFIFQDVLHYGLCDEDVMASMAAIIEDCQWAELEAWLDNLHGALIQCHETEAPAPSTGAPSSPPQGNPPPKQRNGHGGGLSSSGTSRARSGRR